ncbi:hypothetical protein MSSIH_1944 [Methanosarcina siciliae HI350]|uniref:Uncharacterized protein n=2 Tax=Methanosarcina siciliae TaxID=38027 RepID=A0A0E3PFH8_9EURY|nr:hypothetical protein MSSIH_1944 [Methanosarcina siciliae HI350]
MRSIKRFSFFVTVVLIAAMLFASGCSQNTPEEGTTEETGGEVTEEVTEGAVEGATEETTEGVTEETTEGVMETEGEGGYSSVINPDDFVEVIDNPYFPLTPGTTFVYEGESEGEPIRDEVYVTNETRTVMGVKTIVVRDREFEDGELAEETFDWYAQDKDGNVWYFGEDSREYDEGEVVSTEGSWEAGVNGAQPGIIMKGNPQVGDTYRQEYLAGEAEDMAEVVSMNESVSVPYGSFENCLKTREWTPLEPGIEENKYYAAETGLLLEITVRGEAEKLELVEIITE